MRALRLIGQFIRASLQQEVAYRANFLISLLHSLLNLITGVLAVVVLFSQVEQVQGWDFPATLALLGVYLTVGAVRGLFIGPSLDALAGISGEIWGGRFDYTLLRPVDAQFMATFSRWRPLALLDLLLAAGVLAGALSQLAAKMSLAHLLAFLLTLVASVVILYAILLTFTALVFWAPGFLFTWLFDGIFQMARYPVGLYPGWMRLVLTWIVPVGIITTVPAQALAGRLPLAMLFGSMVMATMLLVAASALFRGGLGRYESASS